MSPVVSIEPIVYPESDGNPVADNTRQFECITMIHGGLEAQYRDEADVLVAADNIWYPVQGRPDIAVAPDVYVAFGRPKGYRGCYKQWEEGGQPPQVVFEILSPNNRFHEMERKFRFYERYGVEEYYIYDPDQEALVGYIRTGRKLFNIENMEGHVSPRLGIRFEMASGTLRIIGRDGRPFRTFVEIVAERDQAEAEAARLSAERDTALNAAETERERAERLARKLRELGIDPDE